MPGGCVWWCSLLLLGALIQPAWSKSFPATPDATLAAQQRLGAVQTGFVSSGCWHSPSATTTVSLPACRAQALDTTSGPPRLSGFEEETPRALTFAGGDGSYWLAGRLSPALQPAAWTCLAGTHYCWIKQPTRPAVPPGLVLLSRTEVAAGAASVVADVAIRRLTGEELLSTPRTVDASAVWYVEPGAQIRVAAGVTFLFGGQLVAGRYALFAGALEGGFVFAPGAIVYPEWWGAVADGVTPSASALQAALRATSTGPGTGTGLRVELDCGVYLVDQVVRFPLTNGTQALETGITVQGCGAFNATVLRRAPGYAGVLVEIGASGGPAVSWVTLQDMQLDCLDKAAGTVGLQTWSTANDLLHRLRLTHCERGLYTRGLLVSLRFEDVDIEDNTHGWHHDGRLATGGAISVVQITRGFWRNNTANSLWLQSETAAVPPLMRTFQVSGTVFTGNGVTTGGNVGLRLENVVNFQCHGCHFEGHDPHVLISSATGISTNASGYITFEQCNFGQLNAAAAGTDALRWLDNGTTAQAFNSGLVRSRITAGVVNIAYTQGALFRILDTVPDGTASFVGRYYAVRGTQGGIPELLVRGDTDNRGWVIQSVEKIESALQTTHFQTRYASIVTTDADPTPLDLWTDEGALPTDGAVYIQAYVTAKQADNSDQALYALAGAFISSGGTAVQIGTTESLHSAIESNAGLNATLDTNLDRVRLVVTGLAEASPIYWFGRVEVIRLLATAPAP
jgi:hypothetical protein